MRSLISDDLLAQHQARLTDVDSVRANGQIGHLLLVLPEERAAQPSLFLRCFRAAAQGRDAFVADIDPSGSGNQTLNLVLLFAAEGAHQHRPPFFIEDLEHIRSHLLQVEVKAFQHTGGNAFTLTYQSQQEMLSPNVMMMEAASFINGQLNYLFGTRSQADFAMYDAVSTTNDTLDGLTSSLEIHTQVREHVAGYALPFPKQAQQEVFGADVVVLEALCFFL